MERFEVTVTNKFGLHARPASKLVKLVSKSSSTIFIEKNGRRVNARSILGVMLLEAENGSRVTIEVEGEDESETAQNIRELFLRQFDEE